MGLKNKLHAAKTRLWSPMTLAMLDKGSDTRVFAGHPATVVVEVEGEDDGTMKVIEIALQQTLSGTQTSTLLASLEPTVGRHEIEVRIPRGLAPSTGGFAGHTFTGELRRTRGTGSSVVSPVEVVAHPDDLYWPDGPRTGQTGDGGPTVSVVLDTDVVDIGQTVTGQVTVTGGSGDVSLALGPVVSAMVQAAGHTTLQPRTTFKPVHESSLGAATGGPQSFKVTVPTEVPPTLSDGDRTSVVWQVQVTVGATTGWATVGVLNPGGLATPHQKGTSGLLDLFT